MVAPPSLSAVGGVAVVSAAAHSLLDALPPTMVTRVLSACGARRTDHFDARMWLHSLVMGVAAAVTFAFEWCARQALAFRVRHCLTWRSNRTRSQPLCGRGGAGALLPVPAAIVDACLGAACF